MMAQPKSLYQLCCKVYRPDDLLEHSVSSWDKAFDKAFDGFQGRDNKGACRRWHGADIVVFICQNPNNEQHYLLDPPRYNGWRYRLAYVNPRIEVPNYNFKDVQMTNVMLVPYTMMGEGTRYYATQCVYLDRIDHSEEIESFYRAMVHEFEHRAPPGMPREAFFVDQGTILATGKRLPGVPTTDDPNHSPGAPYVGIPHYHVQECFERRAKKERRAMNLPV